MKRTVLATTSLAAWALAMFIARDASAWEAATHAGIAEEAALQSNLHSQLVSQGWESGLYTTLAIADTAQPALVAMIRRIAPSLGVFLDAKGAAPALSWLVAGALIADIGSAQHHFYTVGTSAGWSIGAVAAKMSGMPSQGVSALTWIARADNPLGATAFYDQLAASASVASPELRRQHLAAALLAAGAITHIVADMGSPSHVKGDEASHTEPLAAAGDRNNRLERVASLAFGRLGVPAPATAIALTSLADYISHPSQGLAPLTAQQWYSENTLPRGQTDAAALPRLPARLSLMAASQDVGTTLRNSDGVCLARYRLAVGRVSFWLDDECRLEQARAILPVVTTYAHGVLQFLFRGRLQITAMSSSALIRNRGVALGNGTLNIYSESETGIRALIGTQMITALAADADVEVPLTTSASPHAVTFVGSDANGQPVTATGAVAAP